MLVTHCQQIRIGNGETGLRAGNKFSPFPEVINRRLIGQMADLHVSPTTHAESTLLSEGFTADDVFLTENTLLDALLLTRE